LELDRSPQVGYRRTSISKTDINREDAHAAAPDTELLKEPWTSSSCAPWPSSRGTAVGHRRLCIAQTRAAPSTCGRDRSSPALHRLAQEGFIQGSWQQSAEGRRTKSYELTASGRRQLEAEKRQWARIVGAVGPGARVE
jgi:hypothetical protein